MTPNISLMRETLYVWGGVYSEEPKMLVGTLRVVSSTILTLVTEFPCCASDSGPKTTMEMVNRRAMKLSRSRPGYSMRHTTG